MDLNPVAALIVTFGRALQRLLRPARSAAKERIGAVHALTRTRPALLAENALLRQPVIVLRRRIGRPRIHPMTACSRPIFAFFFVVHGTREVVYFDVTRCPTDAWAAQRLRETTPYGYGHSYLIRDNDDKFGEKFATAAEGTGVEVVKIIPRSPNLNPTCERFLGSARRECLDHVVILSEQQLRRILKEYVEIYFNRARPHQGLWQAIPVAESRSIPKVGEKLIPIPILGGLHHDYQWAA